VITGGTPVMAQAEIGRPTNPNPLCTHEMKANSIGHCQIPIRKSTEDFGSLLLLARADSGHGQGRHILDHG